MDIQIKPIVTEKATRVTERRGQYTFRVSPDANKFQIKDLVERLYGVKVVSVNTANMRGKNKSRWTNPASFAAKLLPGKKLMSH